MDCLWLARCVTLEPPLSLFDCPGLGVSLPNLGGNVQRSLRFVSGTTSCAEQQCAELPSEVIFLWSEFPSNLVCG